MPRHEAVGVQIVLFRGERGITPLQIANPILRDAMAENQILSARRRANRIRLNELDLRYRARKRARRGQRDVAGAPPRARGACNVTCAAARRSCSSVNPVAMVCIAGLASGPGSSFGKIDPVVRAGAKRDSGFTCSDPRLPDRIENGAQEPVRRLPGEFPRSLKFVICTAPSGNLDRKRTRLSSSHVSESRM